MHGVVVFNSEGYLAAQPDMVLGEFASPLGRRDNELVFDSGFGYEKLYALDRSCGVNYCPPWRSEGGQVRQPTQMQKTR